MNITKEFKILEIKRVQNKNLKMPCIFQKLWENYTKNWILYLQMRSFDTMTTQELKN